MQQDAQLGPDEADGSRSAPGSRNRIVRAGGTTGGRRGIVWSVVLLTVLVIAAIGIAVFSSLSGKTQSYKDGFSSGGTVFAADGTGARPSQACRTAAARPPNYGGVPSGENVTQWINGCVVAFENAQSDN